MPIPTPDRGWKALFAPGEAATYGFDAIPPVAGPGPEYDPRLAALASECARLSYQRDPGIRARALAAAPRLGLREAGCVENRSMACLIVVADSPPLSIVAFRGTDDARDWLTNLHAVTSRWKPGGRTHLGFKHAWYSLAPDLARLLRKLPRTRLLCGHSLGGALASLEASARGGDALYTFGSPRPGNAALHATVSLPHFRVVNDHDPVPELPITGPPFFFAHGGAAIRLDADGVATNDAPSLLERLRALRDLAFRRADDRGLSDQAPRFLADHAPVNYSAKLFAALAQ